jgi:hypothetical protein
VVNEIITETLWKSPNGFWSDHQIHFHICLQPLSLKHLTDGFKGGKTSEEDEINKLFSNVFSVHPPKVIVLYLYPHKVIKMNQSPKIIFLSILL